MKKILLPFALIICADVFTQTFNSVVNEWIPDDGTSITFEMNVSGLPTAIDTIFGLESVCLNINHTWDSDLDIRLVSPDGSSFLLIGGVGWGAVNFTNTCLNENADNALADGWGPYTGVWKPIGDMGAVNNGQDPNGIWKLVIIDTWPFADQGYMLNWAITFGDDPALPFPFYSTQLPIVKINTGGQLIQNEPKTTAEIKIIDHGYAAINHPGDTDYVYDGNILVELQGFTGPGYPKKNYDFDLTDIAGIEIDTVLLGLPAENDFILKAEYLDYSLLKNTLTYEMARRMGRYAPRTKFCELMLDGEYLGVYALTEKVKRDKNRVDIANLDSTDITGEELTGGYIFEINENFTPNDWESDYLPINYATSGLPVAYKMVDPRIEFIQPEQLDYIIAYVDSFEDALYGDDFLDSTTGYRNYISVKSFIDFMIVNEFSSNYDSYGRSTYLFKDKNGEINIGPVWDYDRAYAPWTIEGWVWEITHPTWPFPFWWSKFREDPEWRNEAYCRYTDLRGDVLSKDAFYSVIDSCSAYIHDAAVRNFERWPELGVTDYDYFVDEVRNFVDDRLDWIDDEMEIDFVDAPDASFDYSSTGTAVSFTPAVPGAEYLWDFGDGSTSTEENPVHVYADFGSYTVMLTVNQYYGCMSQNSQIIDVILGIEGAESEQFTIWPNPAVDNLFISLPASTQQYSAEIKNMLGETILSFQTSSSKINIADLPSGNYLLEIKTSSGISRKLFVKS